MRIALLAFIVAVTALVTPLAPAARAQAPNGEIAAVIEDQFAAFLRDDIDAAWSHASPTIQGIFQTPERFGQMVRNGYPMVWRPSHWEMRALTPVGDGFVQSVLIQDRSGQLYIADYEMTLIDGVWRIDGVQLRPAPGVGA